MNSMLSFTKKNAIPEDYLINPVRVCIFRQLIQIKIQIRHAILLKNLSNNRHEILDTPLGIS